MEIILVLGVILLFTIIFKVHEVIRGSAINAKEKRWLTLVLGILVLPILKMLDKILMSIGISEEVAFYISILIVGVVMYSFLNRKMDDGLEVNENS